MEYYYQIPSHSPLHGTLQNCWQVERQELTEGHETIIPKGTVELIFNLNDWAPLTAQINAQRFPIPSCMLSGFNSLPIQMQLPQRHTMFGMVLSPTVAMSLFRVEASDFVNQCLDLTLVHPHVRNLWEQLMVQPSFAGRVALGQQWLLSRLPQVTPQEQFLNQYLTTPATSGLTVPALADQLCFSPRHLTRKLQALTGMNAEQTLLYQKYRYSVELMHTTELSLTAIAHACQFTDQAHFSRTFRTFSHLSPREYRQHKSHIPSHLFAQAAG
ncbi:helix-turn-helix transcriptional regulator [Hymenobacter sp. BT18]|uniref:helix-turn-helix transcriptional regulator n=1 Tax=Hymenobacter sp. BT18 TaxID=2835648 RepID=UPI00143E3011|nr:helix-turn-helix transcriptional regulator [Hymenobacter sp. BT18]QIX60638.1 helix-turn-helix transcriptional regulator [Hymenobacter sp. BT18]